MDGMRQHCVQKHRFTTLDGPGINLEGVEIEGPWDPFFVGDLVVFADHGEDDSIRIFARIADADLRSVKYSIQVRGGGLKMTFVAEALLLSAQAGIEIAEGCFLLISKVAVDRMKKQNVLRVDVQVLDSDEYPESSQE
jgi:hypothetical protein